MDKLMRKIDFNIKSITVKMDSSRKITTRICTFICSRSLFIYAILFILILAKKAKVKSNPSISYSLAYTHIALLYLIGVGMMLRICLKKVCVFHAAHWAWFAYKVYTIVDFGYLQWLRLRIASHTVGVIGVYHFFAALSEHKPSKFLNKISLSFFGIYLTARGFIMNNSLDDWWAFLSQIYNSYYALYTEIRIMFMRSLTFFSGNYYHIVARVAAIIILTRTILIDFDFTYWTKDRHQEY